MTVQRTAYRLILKNFFTPTLFNKLLPNFEEARCEMHTVVCSQYMPVWHSLKVARNLCATREIGYRIARRLGNE